MGRKFSKKILVALTALMLLAMLPININAATPMANWEGTINENAFWPTPSGITYDDRGLTTTPWTSFDIGFQGYSIDGEGRTVINLKLMAYSTALPSTVAAKYNYQYAQFKLDPELNAMVDWDKSFIGTLGYQNDPSKNGAEDKIGFANGVPAQKGVYQVKMDDLKKDGSYSSRVWNNPIKLVLKEGKTVTNLKKDYVVQARFLNLAQNMYRAMIERDTNTGINGYNAYTSSTIVPGKSHLVAGEVQNRATYVGSGSALEPPTFTQSQIVPIYDEENQKLYIYHAQIKQASDYLMFEEGHIGYRISFDQRFREYLKEDDSGLVGYITMGNEYAQPYEGTTKTVALKLGDANTVGESTVFQVGNNDFQKTDDIEKSTIVSDDIRQVYLHSAGFTLKNLFTISVFNINEEKLKDENFTEADKMLESFGLKAGFVLDTLDTQYKKDFGGWSVYKYTPTENLVIPANGKITITTDKPFGKNIFGSDSTDYAVTVAKQLLVRIGGEEGMTYIMPSRTGEYRGLTAVKNNYNVRKFEIPFKEGATIEAGQTIEVFIPVDGDNNGKFTDNVVNLYFNGDEKTSADTVKITQEDPETFHKIHPARVMENASKVAGIVFDRTLRPVVDEIFTDATEYTGNSLYPESTIKAVDITNNNEKTNKVKTTVGSEVSPVVVNGRKYNYAFKFGDITLAGKLLKDRQIPFYNQDVGRLASDNVVEQVQAKVTFNMTDNSVAQVDEKNVLEKVAPLNKEYRLSSIGDENTQYRPSGFAKLQETKDENGKVTGGTVTGADNLKLDENQQVVPVTVVLEDRNETRHVINYFNHNGQTYDIYADDAVTREDKSDDQDYVKVLFSANESTFTDGVTTQVVAYARKGAKFGHVTAALNLDVEKKETWSEEENRNVNEYFTNTWALTTDNAAKAITDDTVITENDAEKIFYAKFSTDRASKRAGLDATVLADVAKQARVDLLKRQFPIEQELTIPANKQLVGWTTVRLTDDPVDQPDGKTAAEKYYQLLDDRDPVTGKPKMLLDEEGDWEAAETEAYIYDEFSPIDKNRTVYAVFGLGGRPAENLTQGYDEEADKQFIAGNISGAGETTPVDPSKTVVTLVNADGSEIQDKNGAPIKATVNSDGSFEFVIDDTNREQLKGVEEVFVQVREESRTRVQAADVNLDLEPPTFTEGKKLTIEVDPYGYQAKVNGEAVDPSGILRFYANGEKESGYYKADASVGTVTNDQIIKVENKTTEVPVVVVDKYGNKAETTLPVETVVAEPTLKVQKPRVGKDYLMVTADDGAVLTIEITRSDSTLTTITHTQVEAQDKITLTGITLAKSDKIKITASVNGQEKVLNTRVR
ncbi:MAG: hypothetical protein Q4E76_06280 [Tissierellia bacterium]|nr:hypothetical protein [Tissierellia bacterium]